MRSVCVHGLGYIGLPTAAMLATAGHDVVGYDIDAALLERLGRGEVRRGEPALDALVSRAVEGGTLEFSQSVVPADYHLVCVPTPIDDETHEADLSFVEAAAEAIAPNLRSGDAVVLESTVPPGTTVERLRPILESNDLRTDSDFSLAYSPETVLPGNALAEMRNNDRIVGGVDEASTDVAVSLYQSFTESEFYRTDATTAEFAKLIQNTYRDVNIALANEFAVLAREHGVDSREAIALGNTHPRVDIHRPGPGVGGHCLPVDPWFLSQGATEAPLVECARRVNDGMVDYVLDLVRAHLGSLADMRLAVLGVAYKGGVADIRQSPTLSLADRLEAEQTASVRFHDPYVDEEASELHLVDFRRAIDGADALVVMTDHDEYADIDPETTSERMRTPVVVDTKDVLDTEQWEDAGFAVTKI